MAHALLPLQASHTITVDISKTQKASTTICKIAIMAAKLISVLATGAGIGYLIGIKTVKSGSCLENSSPTISNPDDAFWNGCCRPLFDFIGCLQQKGIPNFSYILNQCPSSPNCDP